MRNDKPIRACKACGLAFLALSPKRIYCRRIESGGCFNGAKGLVLNERSHASRVSQRDPD